MGDRFMLMLIGLPLGIGLLAATFALLNRRAATVKWPSCERPFPVTAITPQGAKRLPEWCSASESAST